MALSGIECPRRKVEIGWPGFREKELVSEQEGWVFSGFMDFCRTIEYIQARSTLVCQSIGQLGILSQSHPTRNLAYSGSMNERFHPL